MPVDDLPIFTYYNKQRFTQFGSLDCANWYGVLAPDTKKVQALYPAMGRKHIESFGQNVLIFDQEASQNFKTINFVYYIVGTQVIQVDKNYNQIVIGTVPLGSINWFSFLPVGNVIYAILTAFVGIGSPDNAMYLITETPGSPATVTMTQIMDGNAPANPLYVATFGNSIVVSSAESPDYRVSAVNLQGTALNGTILGTASPFTVLGSPLANRSSGVIRQMCTLHNQLYIFNDFNTDIWSNISTQITVNGVAREFPFKLNSSYSWNTGMADPFSLDVDFGRITWLGKNTSGLVTFMTSNGQQPQDISTQAINVLLQNSTSTGDDTNLFLADRVDGFLYQYENTVFYRVTAGDYVGYGELDVNLNDNAIALEYNFDTQRWGRVIELNGERNRIEKHVFFNNKHLVTVQGDTAVYQMAGNIYRNEDRRAGTLPQDANAFAKYPMRYELTTQQIFMPDYSEFITDYIEIDFVFGDKDFYKFDAPFDNTIFIITEDAAPDGTPVFTIAEDAAPDGSPVFLIIEEGNTPGFDDTFYNSLFKPNISLYASDDGGVTFESYDLREFSRLGEYRWRMRWYELGTSRNRVYRLVCVSSAPIVILGAVQSRRRASGGAN